jgi:hypothetical protein
MNDDISEIVGGDAHRAKVLREQLSLLAKGSNPMLREMATGVLNGDLGLRDAAASDVYGDAIGSTFNTFWTKYQDMTPEERTDLIGQGYDYIERAE